MNTAPIQITEVVNVVRRRTRVMAGLSVADCVPLASQRVTRP